MPTIIEMLARCPTTMKHIFSFVILHFFMLQKGKEKGMASAKGRKLKTAFCINFSKELNREKE
jgi:hypothetical protein